MSFLLSSKNVFEYLVDQQICAQEDCDLEQVESKISRNFNLLVTLRGDRRLLVKQEPCSEKGKASDAFANEWRMQRFIHGVAEVDCLRPLMVEIAHMDNEHGILIFNYLSDYSDLEDFYAQQNLFPDKVASLLGNALATVHRSTMGNSSCRNFWNKNRPSVEPSERFDPHKAMRISPEIFGSISSEGMKFFVLLQRYESMKSAFAEVISSFKPCCLAHNDLKFANVLLSRDWENGPDSHAIRFIDWEFCGWGDPAYDLGSIIANYLEIWLDSLVASNSIDITEALRLAVTPLEYVQPSIKKVLSVYLEKFPEILEYYPEFLQQVMKFSGLVLIEGIQTSVHHRVPFGNTDICKLQAAKSLLLNPKQSVKTICGVLESDLIGTHIPLTSIA
jgi:Phosphotransferase enzyme family